MPKNMQSSIICIYFIFSSVSSKLNEKLLLYNFSFSFPHNFASIISYLPLFSTSPLITKLLQVLLLRISTQSAPKKKAATRHKVCTLCFFTGRALIGLTADNNAAILSLAIPLFSHSRWLSLRLFVAIFFGTSALNFNYNNEKRVGKKSVQRDSKKNRLALSHKHRERDKHTHTHLHTRSHSHTLTLSLAVTFCHC